MSATQKQTAKSQVIKSIKQSIEEGIGIVPLIGGGMSAESGIPAGIDYHAYLFYCLARVFGTDGNTDDKKEQWDPSTLRWPDFSLVPIYNDLYAAMDSWLDGIHKKISKKINDPTSKLSEEDRSKWQAIGSVADWRSMLDLLSRLSIQERRGKKEVVLKHPDQRIIDSFFVNITKNKRPNSAHFLLAHLSDIIRVKIILTTNFDNLIETAYQSFKMPVAIYDVHMDASLPDADFVRAQRSIVKMHGGRYGLRADYSLDKYPTTDDVERFVAYLSLYNKDYISLNENQRNLLVMGVSGNERRTIALICHALITLEKLKVYWICYRKEEIRIVKDEFRKTLNSLCKRDLLNKTKIKKIIGKVSDPNDYSGNLKVTNTSSLSLFMLELYQEIFLSLPPSGVYFPAKWTIPPLPDKNLNFSPDDIQAVTKHLVDPNTRKYMHSSIENFGVSSLFAEVFFNLSTQYHCSWIELDQNYNRYDLSMKIIESIARETGNLDLVPTKLAAVTWDPHLAIRSVIKAKFESVLNRSTRRIIIFINGRNIPKEHNLEIIKDVDEVLKVLESEHVGYVILGMGDVHKACDPNEQIIAKYARMKLNTQPKFSSLIPEADQLYSLLHHEHSLLHDAFHDSMNKEEQRVFLHKNFCRFILALTLFRNPSYATVLHSWSCITAPKSKRIGFDKDELRYKLAKEYLTYLRTCNLIRDDDGHFVFIHNTHKGEIKKEVSRVKGAEGYRKLMIECHFGIADWFMKLYRGSGDIQAIFEACHHRICCIDEQIHSPEGEYNHYLDSSIIELESSIIQLQLAVNSFTHSSTLVGAFSEAKKKLKELSGELKQLENKDSKSWHSYKINRLLAILGQTEWLYLDQIGIKPEDGDESIILEPYLSGNGEYTTDNFKPELRIKLQSSKKFIQERSYLDAQNDLQEFFMHILNEVKLEKHKSGGIINFLFTKAPVNANSEDLLNAAKELTGDPGEQRAHISQWIKKIMEVYMKNAREEDTKYEFALHASQGMLRYMVIAARRYQWLELYCAQIERYNEGNVKERKINVQEHLHLVRAELFYIFSTEIMHYIVDPQFLNRENALLRSNTGILLSWMGRHTEASRRYNEAYSYLTFYNKRLDYQYAVIDLRRGESFISRLQRKMEDEAKKSRRKPLKKGSLTDDQKIMIGLLYDAISSISRAEFKLKGTTVNLWWFCWLYEMRLNLCIIIVLLRKEIAAVIRKEENHDKYDMFAQCRECEYCGVHFRKSLQNGSQIVGNDALRVARYIDLTLEFKNTLEGTGDKPEFKEEMKTLTKKLDELKDNAQNPLDDRVRSYIDKLYKKLYTADYV